MRRLPLRLRLALLLSAVGVTPLFALSGLGLAPVHVLWLAPPMLVLGFVLAMPLAHPLEELLAVAQRIHGGELQARTLVDSRSDWALLARVLFGLAERLDTVTRNLEEQVNQRTAALARKADQLRAVGQVGQQVAAVLEPDALLHFVVRMMRGTFGYDVAAVLQRHGEHLVLAACAARGTEEVPLGRVFALGGAGSPPLAACMQQGAAAAGVSPLVSGMAVRAELAVPLRLGERTLGVLAVQSLRPDTFAPDDRFTLETIAGQVAVALENARLFAAERQLRDLSITAERNRMAREIHDTLAQGFMGILMHLRALQGAATQTTAEQHRQDAVALAQESLQEARRSVWALRPQTLEDKGLAGALAAEVRALQLRAGISGTLVTEGEAECLTPPVEAALLRVAQEALHNAAKHARATRVDVHLTVANGEAHVQIADDGAGFDPAALPPGAGGSGFGLTGMAERVWLLGGTLQVESSPGAGCRITARVPLGQAPAATGSGALTSGG